MINKRSRSGAIKKKLTIFLQKKKKKKKKKILQNPSKEPNLEILQTQTNKIKYETNGPSERE
jgi:hypothetical protein